MNTTKTEHKSIVEAMSAVMGEIQDPALDAVNPHFKSKYASLPAVLKAIRPLASKHGLSVVQLIDGSTVQTKVYHSSGGEITSVVQLPPTQSMQNLGSAITYARRYALTAIFAICGDEDDDGNEASKTPAPKPQVASKPKAHDIHFLAGDKLIKGISKSNGKWFAIQRGQEKIWLSEAQYEYLQNSQVDLAAEAQKVFNS